MARMLSGSGGQLRRSLVDAELGIRGQFAGRGILSVSVGSRARSYLGNEMNRFLPDSK